ncbi:polyketide cyclase/dehydrase/lipid transport protein [Novosphingobium kunmingense]|uniref:Polyketide cyclase/dehydrase/lipid transport protein n=1 Tax=Novosphingobium kunmingense TaxID=1211806 RepID=A0A2N0I3S7_9SPHN|nr:SRPBCC family protein [Novosphingobium kunmingense]PKB25837.1 polyketide cyclase/dehydrase/lipid transport protein [Novosphingobium kunmingense]
MSRAFHLGGALALAFTALPTQAEVKSADEAGFVTGGTQDIDASPAAVWSSLVKPAQWWDSAHTWSGKAANLSLDPRAGGCFCERLPGGGSTEHMRVIRADPGTQMILSGALGPLQTEPASGVLIIKLDATEGGSTLTWRYAASGLRGMKGTAIAGPVNTVMSLQFASLARVAASGGKAAPRRR